MILSKDKIERIIAKIIGKPVSNIEKIIFSNENQINFPPIFIIGPARSGTTLVYQCFVQRFRFCYFSNLITFFRYCPALAGCAVSLINGCDPSFDFKSNYGKIKGWNSPNQGNKIWGRWFKGHGPGKEIDPASITDIRRIISSLENCYNIPFITKWPGFGVYLDLVDQVFENAVFIRVLRDPIHTIQSVLRGRHDLHGDGNISISRPPSTYFLFKKRTPIEQVCAYVLGVEKDIDDSMKRLGKNKFFNVEYKKLCSNPDKELDMFKEWYKHNSSLALSEKKRISKNFIVSKKLNIEQKIQIEKICETIKTEIYAIH